MRATTIIRTAALSAFLYAWAGAARGADSAAGHPGDWGAGVVIGDPTGLTAKGWMSRVRALDASLAWDLSGEDDRFQLHLDHLWHFPLDIRDLEGRMPVYVGVGARLLTGRDDRVGIRVPVGVAYLFAPAPVELFAEVVPIVDLSPDTDADVNVGLGVRFYFK